MVVKLIVTKNVLEKNAFIKKCVNDSGLNIFIVDDNKFDQLLNSVKNGEIKDTYTKILINKLDMIRNGTQIGRLEFKERNRLENICNLEANSLPNLFHVKIGKNGRMFYSLIYGSEKITAIVGDKEEDVQKGVGLILSIWNNLKIYDKDMGHTKKH